MKNPPIRIGTSAFTAPGWQAGADLSFQVCAPRLYQEMELIGHQHPPHQPKPQLLAQPAQDFGEYLAEAFADKERQASVGAGSDKLQMPRIEDAVNSGAWSESLAQNPTLSNRRRPEKKGLRQPPEKKREVLDGRHRVGGT